MNIIVNFLKMPQNGKNIPIQKGTNNEANFRLQFLWVMIVKLRSSSWVGINPVVIIGWREDTELKRILSYWRETLMQMSW